MDKHTFSKLQLIFTIDYDIGELLSKIASEEARITHLDKERSERQLHLDHSLLALKNNKEMISKEEKELSDMENTFKKAEQNQGLATNQAQLDASTKTVELLGPKIEESEMLILDLLEKKDELEKKIAQDQRFLDGSQITRGEIKKEVDQVCLEMKSKASELEENIQTLLSDIPQVERELVVLTRQKYRFKRPMAKVIGNNCAECGATIDRMTQSQLAKQISIELCPGCRRILMLGGS